jgi:hypothetical protein
MPEMGCPNCDGTRHSQEAAGEEILCPMCDGIGSLVTHEGAITTERCAQPQGGLAGR